MIQQNHIELTAREEMVLKATIEDYIEANHPIGSIFLKKRHLFSYSPATIRHILASLEVKGLLTHPHTSSGRTPTDIGYRYYVDELLDQDDVKGGLDQKILDRLFDVASNLDDLMQATATMLAKVCQLFGVVMISGVQKSILTDIELIPLSTDRIMMVLALKSGLIRSLVLNLKVVMNEKQVKLVNSILNERLVGLSLVEIQRTIHQRLQDTEVYEHEIIQILVDHPHLHFSLAGNTLVYTSSYNELLNYPEFQEVDTLQKTMRALEEKNIKQFLTNNVGLEKEYTFIGQETNDDLMNHCSILTARFDSELLTGQLAVLGPTRLPYKHVKHVLENFVEILPNVY